MKKDVIQILIAFILFIISLFLPFPNSWVHTILYLISYLILEMY